MIQPSITISLLPNHARAPFVLGPDLDQAVALAAEIGYPAFELFPPDLSYVDVAQLKNLTRDHGVRLSTIGTGGGWVTKQWSLIDPDPAIQRAAFEYIAAVIRRAAELNASAIIGSMQGKCGSRDRAECLKRLAEQLNSLGEVADEVGQSLFYEPLNRYETDLFNSVIDTANFLNQGVHDRVRILADLFHMNIEEVDSAAAIRTIGSRIGHVHFVDSNRQAPGLGHTDFAPIRDALKSIQFQGYLAIEAFPLPTPEQAARQALETYRRYFVS